MQLIVMSFDGDTQTEGHFDTLEELNNHAANMGSRWYFYPFCLAVTDSGKTVKEFAMGCEPEPLQFIEGKRLETVRREFARLCAQPAAQGLDCYEFAFFVADNWNPQRRARHED